MRVPINFAVLGDYVSRPSEHPDFLSVTDESHYQPPARDLVPVYVPMVAHLIQRMGGLFNIENTAHEEGDCCGPSEYAGILVSRFPDGDGGWVLEVSCWSTTPSELLLTVHFVVPEKWAVGEWKVGYVYREDTFASTKALRVDIARLCDFMVGHAIATREENLSVI